MKNIVIIEDDAKLVACLKESLEKADIKLWVETTRTGFVRLQMLEAADIKCDNVIVRKNAVGAGNKLITEFVARNFPNIRIITIDP